MPRPRSPKQINYDPQITYFKPRGIPLRSLREVSLNLEELEALRLKNLENLDQNQAAQQMKISQSTFQRILSSAYRKISLALIEGRAIKLDKS